jgi:4-amino-4-deoxy-L-arabinose transferase-like glycosyltransferase
MNKTSISLEANTTHVSAPSMGVLLALAVILFLAFYNLTGYPLTWFDEGSHLHVPKTLVRFGVYADYSSEGFRYFGPTIGVGPTVMLPIAAVFRLFGIGLFQARLVMAVYLLAAIYVFFRFAYSLGGSRIAWAATALLVASRSTGLVEYGRQVLGEVPGFFFLVWGLGLWFSGWERSSWKRLAGVGLLFGLAMVTKYQYLIILAPTLTVAWLANWFYYRTAPHRVFIAPGLVAAAGFGFWQLYLILYLGPATAAENLAQLRAATAGAALVFSPSLMLTGFKALLGSETYLGSLLLVVVYGAMLALPRRREGQQWGILFLLIAVNLSWFIVASISWLRYAFLGLSLASLFIARLIHDFTDGFQLNLSALKEFFRRGEALLPKQGLHWALLVWLVLMVGLPLGRTVPEVASPAFNAPAAMAAHLNQHVPQEALIETWEPEMGFLTGHRYHFPPAWLLNKAVGYMWLDGPAPSESYDFVQAAQPEYVLVGKFARWVRLYPTDWLADHYQLESQIGYYELYRLEK